MTRWALLLLALSACNDAGPDDRACTEIGCGSSGARFELGTFAIADVMPTATTAAEVEVCLNNQCSTIVLGQLPSSDSIEIRGAVVVPNVTMSAVLGQASQDAISVVVNVQGPDGNPFHDGDIYRVKVTSPDDRVLADHAWSVDYKLTQPNGPQCEPTCAQAMTTTEL